MEGTFIFIATFAAVVLVLIVLIQNPKGGGLASSFSSANQIGGVRRTTDFLDKATWTLAIGIVVLSLASTWTMDKGTVSAEVTTEMQEALQNRRNINPAGAATFNPDNPTNFTPETPQ